MIKMDTTQRNEYTFSSESVAEGHPDKVAEGHPDKVADQISDSVTRRNNQQRP